MHSLITKLSGAPVWNAMQHPGRQTYETPIA
jgi:hypothetical protein